MKNLTFILISCILFVFPSKGWTQKSVKEELKLIIEEIQSITNKEKNSGIIINGPPIIAIGGCPGVGKSTLAQLLQVELAELGIVSVTISLDHYGLSQNERKQFASELDPRRIQWGKLHSNLTSIRKGETKIIKPIINQLTKEMGEETLNLANVDCILFEGLYALADFSPMNFLQYADLTMYIEASSENIYDWKWQRELKKSAPRSAQEFFFHMMEIWQDFAFHVYPTRKNADLIIHADFFHHYSITNDEAIKTRAAPDFTPLRMETLTY